MESGASKDDVELISDVDLKRLYNSKSISVDAIYSEVDAVTGEIREVPSDEVDSLLDRLEKEKEANIAKFLNSSNLNNPNDITMSSGYDSETTADGYLQQTIYIAETGTNKVYNVMYTAKWLKEIANTKIDVFGIAVSNAYPIKGTEHSYQQAMYVTASDGKRSSTGYIPLNTTDYFYGSEGIVQKVNLFSSEVGKYYYDWYVTMNFDVKVNNTSATAIAASGYYRHQERTVEVSPSVSAIGWSIGIGVTFSSDMKNMTPNPYTTMDIR